MAINPLFYNQFFKTERHNSSNPFCKIYARGVEQMLNIYGVVLFYFPISEYNLQSISALWGEDINKKYLERYTLKGITEAEADNFVFNRFGIDKTTAERTIFISKKQFFEVTGRRDPLEGDLFQWTQNNIIYEITSVTDQENIVLGQELTWKLVATPRTTEGEVFGRDNGDSSRDAVIDLGLIGNPTTICDKFTSPIDDGNIIENPATHIPSPSPHILDDEPIVDRESETILIRKSWGGWDDK
jgi:hypothetical protein